ncbi:MAG TPA: sulfotransferase [Oligoflexia bacterium]|nr:sulfotransferase [Oligoflexia bacterium]HMP48787.1 sulfotransferase [Oligoflexia bacterium]
MVYKLERFFRFLLIWILDFCYFGEFIVKLLGIWMRPVFIVGCGHSGTTIMARILAEHSRIKFIPYETEIFFKVGGERIFCYLKFLLIALLRGHKYVLEKTPSHILHLNSILSEIPKAKVIVLIRDGRDVALSRRDRNGSTVETEIIEWVERNKKSIQFFKHPSVKIVRYEDFIHDSSNVINDILLFLNLPNEYLLNYHKKPVTWGSKDLTRPQRKDGSWHGQYRNWQINQPLYSNSVGRWKSEMSYYEKLICEKHAADLLKLFGY